MLTDIHHSALLFDITRDGRYTHIPLPFIMIAQVSRCQGMIRERSRSPSCSPWKWFLIILDMRLAENVSFTKLASNGKCGREFASQTTNTLAKRFTVSCIIERWHEVIKGDTFLGLRQKPHECLIFYFRPAENKRAINHDGVRIIVMLDLMTFPRGTILQCQPRLHGGDLLGCLPLLSTNTMDVVLLHDVGMRAHCLLSSTRLILTLWLEPRFPPLSTQ